jgi:diadenosine tetraphosphate (Ap4A) HIT family hydrolase
VRRPWKAVPLAEAAVYDCPMQPAAQLDAQHPAMCPFCESLAQQGAIVENDHAAALADRFPVSAGHTLVVSKRHVADYFLLEPEEQESLWALVTAVAARLRGSDHPEGFNVGVNVGAAAGQTVAHAHVHVIPRYAGDLPDPRGGVRWVLPEKAAYWPEGRARAQH